MNWMILSTASNEPRRIAIDLNKIVSIMEDTREDQPVTTILFEGGAIEHVVYPFHKMFELLQNKE